MGTTDSSIVYHGWNIDDASFTGTFSLPTNLSVAWVDFAFVGIERGTSAKPFNTLGEAVAALIANGSGVIQIKGNTATNSSKETLKISKPMTIRASSGAVTIGGT